MGEGMDGGETTVRWRAVITRWEKEKNVLFTGAIGAAITAIAATARICIISSVISFSRARTVAREVNAGMTK